MSALANPDLSSPAMVTRRLRAVSGRLEQVCIEKRRALSGQTIACDGCHADAEFLRALAEQMGPKPPPSAPAHFNADVARTGEPDTKTDSGRAS